MRTERKQVGFKPDVFWPTGTSINLPDFSTMTITVDDPIYHLAQYEDREPDTWQCAYCGTSHWVEDRQLQCRQCGAPREV